MPASSRPPTPPGWSTTWPTRCPPPRWCWWPAAAPCPRPCPRRSRAAGEVLDTIGGHGPSPIAVVGRASPQRPGATSTGPALARLSDHLGEDMGRLAGSARHAGRRLRGGRLGRPRRARALPGRGRLARPLGSDRRHRRRRHRHGARRSSIACWWRGVPPAGGAGHPPPALPPDPPAGRVGRDHARAGSRGPRAAQHISGQEGPGPGRRLGSARIARAITLLAEADLDLRGATGLPGEVVLEVLVARLSRLAREGSAAR